MDIGTLLKLKRKELNLSVKQVVDSLKSYNISISEKTLYGWENNYRQPDADTFLILCAIYQISNVLGYFLNEQTKDYSTKESILIKKYRQLTADSLLRRWPPRISTTSSVGTMTSPNNSSMLCNLICSRSDVATRPSKPENA